MSEAARHSGREKCSFCCIADYMRPVEQREITPCEIVQLPVAPQVVDDPGELVLFRVERECADLVRRLANGI